MTRDEARRAYAEADMDFFPVSHERMTALRDTINDEMLSEKLMGGTFHMNHPASIKVRDDGSAELRCSSYYFDNREAVTFNSDGFIGFAGWADDTHIQPILRGFIKWVNHEAEIAELN